MTVRRRSFLAGMAAARGAGGLALSAAARRAGALTPSPAAPIDFRYAPLQYQTAYCFPDDAKKSLVSHRGELLYGHPGRRSHDYAALIVEFSVAGMESDVIARQELESPGVPIVHTRLERPEAFIELTTFASGRDGEGRVDNVLMEIRPRARRRIHAAPLLTVRTRQEISVKTAGSTTQVFAGAALLMIADKPLVRRDLGWGFQLASQPMAASGDRPLRCFFRFPQDGQAENAIAPGLAEPDQVLASARVFWRGWRPCAGEIDWQLPAQYQNFLTACARNILQAREVRNGRLTFQVGPTVYRGLWIVDGNFILEAARYLGHDKEAQQGLETTWSMQEPSGAVLATPGLEQHWKDTAIAMFTMVRQAELARDWSYFDRMTPNILKGLGYLQAVRDRGKTEASANAKYGILPRGFGDGGLRFCSEFTNTVWALAGLKAVAGARRPALESVARFYGELRAAFDAAARQEMRRHPAGFDYLPMLMKEDASWTAPDEWARPQPQVAQWALSHAIYPGLVFAKDDPIVKGHIALMQSCTREDVPVETGWLPHEGLWTYNAPFVAHVYLWAGEPDWAALTFRGFLNHASPLYAWREEQALRGSLVSGYVGDMPHNWASAECVLFLRHMMALEDGPSLRLLEGIRPADLASREAFLLRGTPTRFGRLNLWLQPARQGWQLRFERSEGPAPGAVELPASLGPGAAFTSAAGADAKRRDDRILIDPSRSAWTARFES